MKKVKVNLKNNSYKVIVGSNLVNEENLKILKNKEVLLVVDKNVPSQYKELITKQLINMSSCCQTLEIKPSETNKNTKTLDKIHSKLIEERYSRDCILIGLGGGITCDITGFAAATYQRGVDFILFPSTLLSQVDASVGGKTAINHPQGKNMIGAFHQPKEVFADVDILSSLPDIEISNGLSEVIKHALIADKDYFSWLEINLKNITSLDSTSLEHAITKSIEIKAKIVSEDEKEKGIRKLLNFGHTFGHAIEAYNGFKNITHGAAITLGMVIASKISYFEGHIKDYQLDNVINAIEALGLNTDHKKYKYSHLKKYITSDKKVADGKINLVLIDKKFNAFKTSKFNHKNIIKALS